MFCPQCHIENRPNAKFCKGCGESLLPDVSPVQESQQPPVCSACGMSNNFGAKFCSKCGTKLSLGGHLTPPPPPPTQTKTALPAVEKSPAKTMSDGRKLGDEPDVRELATGKPVPENRQKFTVSDIKPTTGKTTFVPLVVAGLLVVGAGAWFALRNSSSPEVPAPAASPAPVESIRETSPPAAPVASPVPVQQTTASTSPEPAVLPAAVLPPPIGNASPPITPKIVDADTHTDRKSAPRIEPKVQKSWPDPGVPATSVKVRKPVVSPPVVAATPAPVPTKVRPADPDWYSALKKDLGSCNADANFFTRTLCVEKAKWRYCAPGNHWGEVTECVQPKRSEISH